MEFVRYWNDRVRKFTIFDLKLAQAAAIFGTLIVAKLWPSILDINILWFAALGALSVIRPAYTMFLKP